MVMSLGDLFGNFGVGLIVGGVFGDWEIPLNMGALPIVNVAGWLLLDWGGRVGW